MYKTSVRDMVKALKSGAFLGLIMDQDPGENGVLVPFFGYETLTADGPAVLGRMQDVPIIFVTMHYSLIRENMNLKYIHHYM